MTGKERQQKALAIFQKMDKTVSSAQKKKNNGRAVSSRRRGIEGMPN